MTLELANARYEWADGYPLLKLDVNGREAVLSTEWKPALREQGLVSLGDEFEDLVQPVVYRTPEGGETTLTGFSDDPRLFRLFEQFWNAQDRKDGPVPIPA